MQRITPCLWFDTEAEEAANFYVGIFEQGSAIETITRYGEAGPRPAGSVLTVAFRLEGQEFIALNGGPEFKFTEAISLTVNCKTQDEVDYYWERLTEGGQEVQCGWLKDRYGLSWQVVPTVLMEMINDPDPQKAKRVTEAMLKMKKIDIAKLEAAYEQ